MFKLLGPLSKSIRQNSIGYSFVLKERTIFQFKNFFGKSDLLKVGDTVAFIVVASFDRKRQIETEEAMVITPFKSQK